MESPSASIPGCRTPRGPPPWLLPSLLAIGIWGIWGLQTKIVSSQDRFPAIHLPPALNQVVLTAGQLLIVPLVLFAGRRGSVPAGGKSRSGLVLAVIAGLLGSSGLVLYFTALNRPGSQASVVVPFTALYPMVTVLIALVILRERIGGAQVAGLALAAAAIGMMSHEGKVEEIDRLARGALAGKGWFWLSVAVLGIWGLSSIFQKLAADREPPGRCFAAYTSGYVVFAALLPAISEVEWKALSPGSAAAGALGGILNGLGLLAVIVAFRRGGKASVIAPLTALYPLITLALALGLLGERPLPWQLAGALAAVASGFLLGREPARPVVRETAGGEFPS